MSASLLGEEATRFDTGDIEMLTNLEIVTLSAVIAICVVAAWTTGQQPSSMSLIFNAPSIARSVPAGAFGSAKSLLREADGSFDQVWLGPFLSLP